MRLRGDWSDTGPQALPESERRTQTGGIFFKDYINSIFSLFFVFF